MELKTCAVERLTTDARLGEALRGYREIEHVRAVLIGDEDAGRPAETPTKGPTTVGLTEEPSKNLLDGCELAERPCRALEEGVALPKDAFYRSGYRFVQWTGSGMDEELMKRDRCRVLVYPQRQEMCLLTRRLVVRLEQSSRPAAEFFDELGLDLLDPLFDERLHEVRPRYDRRRKKQKHPSKWIDDLAQTDGVACVEAVLIHKLSARQRSANARPAREQVGADRAGSLLDELVESATEVLPDLRIAVIDAGFDLDHPGLEQTWDSAACFNYDEAMDGRLKRQVFYKEADSLRRKAEFPRSDHGTQCAGVAVGRCGHGSSLDGVASGVADLFPIALREPAQSQLALAWSIAFAVQPEKYVDEKHRPRVRRADFISISLGPSDRPLPVGCALDTALQLAKQRDVPIFWAAPNCRTPEDGGSAAAHPSVIGVAAVDAQGEIRDRARGRGVDFRAPGISVRGLGARQTVEPKSFGSRTVRFGAPTSLTGSSFAAPCAAGVAAMVLVAKRISAGYRPRGKEIREILERSAFKPDRRGRFKDGRNEFYGHGVLDAVLAVRSALGAPIDAAADSDGGAGSNRERRALRLHGGFSHQPQVVRSRLHQGKFGRLFRRLPPWRPPGRTELERLGQLADLADTMHFSGRPEVSSQLPAPYTFLGQFIDHDITFDATSTLARQNDPDQLENFRTPAFDLDSVYAGGPRLRPEIYDPRRDRDPLKDRRGYFRLGRAVAIGDDEADPEGWESVRTELDLPRSGDQATIGDPRNDENLIISQLQLALLRFHNVVLHLLKKAESGKRSKMRWWQRFHAARRIVRWHYQWIVLEDFLPRIIGPERAEKLRHPRETDLPKTDPPETDPPGRDRDGFVLGPPAESLRFYRPRRQAFLPVEFSVAAFRFGHSILRSRYALKDGLTLPLFDTRGRARRGQDLRGGRVLKQGWSIDWREFFKQKSLKINTELSPTLSQIPGSPAGASLAFLNLARGWRLDLPSGEAVARRMGAEPLDPGDVDLPIQARETPLWFYCLREAEVRENGEHLGPVGGRIVAETLLGLAIHDSDHYLNQEPGWEPDPARELWASLDGGPGFEKGEFKLRHLLDIADTWRPWNEE